jgi:hypothetical protein
VFRFVNWPTDRRKRLLSVAGAAILVVLFTTAVAVYLNGGKLPLTQVTEQSQDKEHDYPLGIAPQPGASPSASRSTPPPATSTPSPTPTVVTSPAPPLTARYRTLALLGLGGFDTELTVRNPGDLAHGSWTVVVTMPGENKVQNLKTDLVAITQTGKTVTITPVSPTLAPGAAITFTVRFPALLALGQSITDCKINGVACAAG